MQHSSDNTDVKYNNEKALHERAKWKITELELAEKEELSLIQMDEAVRGVDCSKENAIDCRLENSLDFDHKWHWTSLESKGGNEKGR